MKFGLWKAEPKPLPGVTELDYNGRDIEVTYKYDGKKYWKWQARLARQSYHYRDTNLANGYEKTEDKAVKAAQDWVTKYKIREASKKEYTVTV